MAKDAWSISGRAGYTFVPYGKLQQGTTEAANPNELAIDVHLGTAQLQVSAPTGTTLDLQLPFGSLTTSSILGRRTDQGLGDLEVRARQGLGRWLSRPTTSITLGGVVPSGPYVARSGAANLAPEANALTLGRGVVWGIAEIDSRLGLTPRTSMVAQLSGRVPLGRASDGFDWGPELRATAGVQIASITPWLSAVASTDVQWRAGATEPDPFMQQARLTSANVGGLQWSVSPAAWFKLPGGMSLVAGLRIPVINDVTGNQLVPQTGGFVALSYAARLGRPPAPAIAAPAASHQITVVDYWATWCAPCTEISRALAAASARWPDVRIIKIDATEWPGEQAPVLPTGAQGLPVIEIFDRTGARIELLTGADALRVVEVVDRQRRATK